jgi:diguanylate cyclase (GGDEF)-like protein
MLDVRTLLFSIAAGFAAMGVMGLLLGAQHRQERAIGYWSAGCFVVAAANALLIFREELPALLTIVLANGLTVLGAFLLQAGFAGFYRRPKRLGLGVALTLACMALLAWWTYVRPDFNARVLVVTVALLPAFALTMLHPLRDGDGPYRLLRHSLAALFGLLILASLARIAAAIVDPAPADAALFAPSPMHTIWYVAVLAVMFVSSLNFLLMPAQRAQMELSDLADVDELTGLLNRRAFRLRFAQTAAVGRPSVMLLDLDHFKPLNDRHGHAAGDAVLRAFAATAAGQLRRHDVFARHGGDEFAVLLPDTEVGDALQVAERVREAVGRMEVRFGDLLLRITVSIGVAAVPRGAAAHEAALALADQALYRAKSLGRNRVCTPE